MALGFNNWALHLLGQSLFVFFVSVIGAFALYLAINKKLNKAVAIFFVGALVLFQVYTTPLSSLSERSNDEIRVRDERLSYYAQTATPRMGHYLENRSELLVLNRVKSNFFEAIDINNYFFAGHPRERVGVDETEKLSFVLLPFFLIGFFTNYKNKLLLASLLLPLAFLAIMGTRGSLGSVGLFPFIVVATAEGLRRIRRGQIKIAVLAFLIIVFIQIGLYEGIF